MSQDPLCPILTKRLQRKVSQMVNRNISLLMLLGGLSVNLNHLTTKSRTVHFRSSSTAVLKYRNTRKMQVIKTS